MATVNFPQETTLGRVFIEGNKLISKGQEWHYDAEIELDQVVYIYSIIDKELNACLFFFDHTQHWIPVNYSGFSKVFEELSLRFELDKGPFFQNLADKKPIKNQIWRKKNLQNYSLIPDGNFSDYAAGFEIQSPRKTFIKWDTKFSDLHKSEDIFYEIGKYHQLLTKFKFPVRIGNIIFYDLCIFDNEREDVAAMHFYSQCFNNESNDGSYFDIRDLFIKDFAVKDRELVYERKDQTCYYFNAKGMAINLVYTYDSDYAYDGGYTSFEVKNEREYPELLIDTDYEQNGQVSDYLLIDEKIDASANYKFNNKVKLKFSKLNPGAINKPIIWIDSKNDKIGFADKKHYQVFKRSDITGLIIQNILPAKGGGGGYLNLSIKGKNYSTILTGKCFVFDKYADLISKLIGKSVEIGPEMYDC